MTGKNLSCCLCPNGRLGKTEVWQNVKRERESRGGGRGKEKSEGREVSAKAQLGPLQKHGSKQHRDCRKSGTPGEQRKKIERKKREGGKGVGDKGEE
eukprot:2869133-Rhodomonas_salina.1